MSGRDNLSLLVPKDPVDPDTSGWATVTDDSPLRIRLDGETSELPFTPDTLVAGLAIGNRVWVTLSTSPDQTRKSRQVVIIGKAQ